jgi:hypothetical protein
MPACCCTPPVFASLPSSHCFAETSQRDKSAGNGDCREKPVGIVSAIIKRMPLSSRCAGHEPGRSQEVCGGTFLKQSVRLPGYGIEHEKVFRENKCESGLQKGPALAGVAWSSSRHGQELAAVRMRRLAEISGGGKATA